MEFFKKSGFLLFVFLGFQIANAQEANSQNRCGTETPSQQWEAEFQKLVAQTETNKTANKTQQVYVIPVIMHVIHGGQPVGTYPNLAQGQLVSQIQVLNNDYGGTGFNTGNYPANAFAAWASTANVSPASLDANGRVAIANCNVQFCLATVDPDGNILPEPGIERINYNSMGWGNPAGPTMSYTPFKNLMDNTIKPQTIWDVTKYLNIWISDGNTNITGGLYGYATFPYLSTLNGIFGSTGTASNDGFWCYAQAFGSVGSFPGGTYAPGYTRGRTATHEIGHWLGLRHIWGDGQCATDFCNDTPAANNSNVGSPTYPHDVNVCSGSGDGEMFMNFMDYTNSTAMYMFTTDQANRIQTAMANSPYRKFLGTHNLCSVENVAATSAFTSPSQVCTGRSLNLSNASSGWPAPSYSWSATGGTFSPSPQAISPSIQFSTPGIYVVTLTSNNGTVSVFNKTITVTSPTLYLSSLSQTICQGSSATFNATGVDTYTWQPGNVVNPAVSFTPTASQTYTCEGTEINGCRTSSVVQVVVEPCVGIEAHEANILSLVVYPNPAQESLNLQVSSSSSSQLNIEITDAVGRMVHSSRLNTISGTQVFPVNIVTFDNGIYFIKVQTQNGVTSTAKFVKRGQ